ncbi:EamA domain-containing membrane protein RarD [Gemmobacter aquatilis]|uniref:EamA domain-containing membrane protein RarD n=1 Tax=Gemmobacter aquatilis TaxID=933059 RepID=A0A1H7ZPU4_9RHOB|nr:DMT family transporter [Gemmobacter aquatilis]SEM59437.1 EamA domain-containing membrane protein RarD [Gemmobacter aquatilis]
MDLRALGMGLAFALIWSSAYATARVIVTDAPPLLALAIRFSLSGALALAVGIALGQSLRLTRAQWRATLIFGFCQNAVYLGLNFVAMQWIEASLAAIIASTMPLLVATLGWAFFKERIRPLGIAGLVLGFAGVAVIMAARMQGGAAPLGLALCLVAAFALALATLMLRGAASGGNLWIVVGLQMWVGAVVLGVATALLEPWQIRLSPHWVAAMAYQIVMPGIVATLLWFGLVRRIGAVKAATFHFLNPFFGVVIAALLLGEAIRLTDMIGVAIVMAGILAVQLSRQVPA